MEKLKKIPFMNKMEKTKVNESYSVGQKITFNEPLKYKDTLFEQGHMWEIRDADSTSTRIHNLMLRKDWIGVSVDNKELDNWINTNKVELS